MYAEFAALEITSWIYRQLDLYTKINNITCISQKDGQYCNTQNPSTFLVSLLMNDNVGLKKLLKKIEKNPFPNYGYIYTNILKNDIGRIFKWRKTSVKWYSTQFCPFFWGKLKKIGCHLNDIFKNIFQGMLLYHGTNKHFV